MSKKKKVNMKKRKVDIKDKFYDISKIDLAGKEDLKEVLKRLKEHYIKDIFTITDEKNMGLKQICVTVFKSEKYGIDEQFSNFVFSSYFINPKNKDKKIPISIFGEPTVIKLIERNTKDVPLKLDFLESNINNAIIFTFTESKNKIEVEMDLLKGDKDPVFDYYRDIKFINPHDYGYIASIIKLNDSK